MCKDAGYPCPDVEAEGLEPTLGQDSRPSFAQQGDTDGFGPAPLPGLSARPHWELLFGHGQPCNSAALTEPRRNPILGGSEKEMTPSYLVSPGPVSAQSHHDPAKAKNRRAAGRIEKHGWKYPNL